MLDIVCLGNAMIDLKTEDSNEYLKDNIKYKGSSFEVPTQEFPVMLEGIKNYDMYTGGSVANSAKIFSFLGGSAAFVGKVGKDEYGEFFKSQLESKNVVPALKVDDKLSTGCSVVFIHKDKERTVCAKRRASKIIKVDDINWDLIKSAKMVFIEGYWLDDNLSTVQAVIDFAKENRIKVAFSLSDPKVVSRNIEFFEKNAGDIDVLFGNKAEFSKIGQNLAKLNVKTLGKDGVEVFDGRDKHEFKALPLKKIVNTNGAGDAFAGGFLWAKSNNFGLAESVRFGQECSIAVISNESAGF